ncbi:MAG: amino acid ABC transporter ATP-binding protein [Lysinibacillus sp.]
MINVQQLNKAFGDNVVLQNISLNVAPHEVVAVIGPSGSGKSTLLRCLNGLEDITSGVVIIDNIKVDATEPKRMVKKAIHEVRQKTGMVFQQFNLYAHKTAVENVMEALIVVKKMKKDVAYEKAAELLRRVGLGERLDFYPSKLSGGQQQRVGIARALAMEPKIMLFDEPTSALDPELVGEVLNVMKNLAEEGMTMLVVTHEMKFANDVADRVIFMADGKVVEDAPAQHFFESPQTERAQQFLRQVNEF